MAQSFLKKVVKEKLAEVNKAKQKVPLEKLLENMLALPPVRNFRETLFNAPRISVIAEVKRKTPGQAAWKPRYQPGKLVAAYIEGGAIALSVVTDNKYFGGSLGLIDEMKQVSKLPVLRKDFIVDPYQVYESRAARADAVLLLADALPDKSLPRLVELVGSLGMTAVVEVHALADVKRAARSGTDILLINNRDLNTLKVNMQTVERLAKLVPKDHLAIAASGYQRPEDVAKIYSERVRAVLIGKALSSDKNPEVLIREIRNKVEKA